MSDSKGFDTASSLPIDTQVPGYRLRRQVGEDAVGFWFDAEQESLGRKVTVKLLRPEFEHHAGARVEFLAEMDRLAPLDHPNIPRVLDSRRANPLALVTERIGPRMLSSLLQPGKPAGEQVSLLHARCVARALDCLVEQDLAHRNVTPMLISLREDEGCRLTTFRNVLPIEEFARLRGRLIQDPNYVAPEQVAGSHAIGPGTASYHVAALLFHMLAGRPPHGPGSPQELARAHYEEEFPSLKRFQPFLSKGIYGLIAACTQKDPTLRPDPGHVAEALAEILEGRDPGLQAEDSAGPAAPRSRRRRRRR